MRRLDREVCPFRHLCRNKEIETWAGGGLRGEVPGSAKSRTCLLSCNYRGTGVCLQMFWDPPSDEMAFPEPIYRKVRKRDREGGECARCLPACLLACLPVNFEALLSVYPSCRATQLEVDSSIPTTSPPASTDRELVPSLNFGCSALGYQSDRGGMFLDRSISCSCPLVRPRLDGQ